MISTDIRIVLVEPSHSGDIGAAWRAILWESKAVRSAAPPQGSLLAIYGG